MLWQPYQLDQTLNDLSPGRKGPFLEISCLSFGVRDSR